LRYDTSETYSISIILDPNVFMSDKKFTSKLLIWRVNLNLTCMWS